VHRATSVGQPEYVGWKECKQVAQDLKSVYHAVAEEEAGRKMAAFAERWNQKCPTIAALWQRTWERVIPFFAFPPEVRKVIYAVESLNMSLRKALKKRVALGKSVALEGGPEPVHPRLGRSDTDRDQSVILPPCARTELIRPAAADVKAGDELAALGLDGALRQPNIPIIRV
jgi:hypothetical protein